MSRENVNIVIDIYAAFARRDAAAVLASFAPDIEIQQSAALPWGGEYKGAEGAQAFFGKLLANITSTVTVDRYLDAGDRVVAIGWTRGAVNATGARFDVPLAHVWTIRDGKVAQILFCIDNPTMLGALDKRAE